MILHLKWVTWARLWNNRCLVFKDWTGKRTSVGTNNFRHKREILFCQCSRLNRDCTISEVCIGCMWRQSTFDSEARTLCTRALVGKLRLMNFWPMKLKPEVLRINLVSRPFAVQFISRISSRGQQAWWPQRKPHVNMRHSLSLLNLHWPDTGLISNRGCHTWWKNAIFAAVNSFYPHLNILIWKVSSSRRLHSQVVDQLPYLVVVMELDWVPLAVADPACDVGGHRGLGLTWVTRTGWSEEEEEKEREKIARWMGREKRGKIGRSEQWVKCQSDDQTQLLLTSAD